MNKIGELVEWQRQVRREKPAPVSLCPPQIPYRLGIAIGPHDEKLVTNNSNYGMASILLNEINSPTQLHEQRHKMSRLLLNNSPSLCLN